MEQLLCTSLLATGCCKAVSCVYTCVNPCVIDVFFFFFESMICSFTIICGYNFQAVTELDHILLSEVTQIVCTIRFSWTVI